MHISCEETVKACHDCLRSLHFYFSLPIESVCEFRIQFHLKSHFLCFIELQCLVRIHLKYNRAWFAPRAWRQALLTIYELSVALKVARVLSFNLPWFRVLQAVEPAAIRNRANKPVCCASHNSTKQSSGLCDPFSKETERDDPEEACFVVVNNQVQLKSAQTPVSSSPTSPTNCKLTTITKDVFARGSQHFKWSVLRTRTPFFRHYLSWAKLKVF